MDLSSEIATPPVIDSEETLVSARKSKARRVVRRPVFSDTIPAVPVAAFHRLVREISADHGKGHIRWEAKALEALQVDTEALVTEQFQKAHKQSLLCKRRTVGRKHWHAVKS